MFCNFLQFGDATFSNSRLQLSVILFYNKHSLALLGFNIYIIKGKDKEEEQIVICRGKLKKGDTIKGTNLGDDILFVRKIG